MRAGYLDREITIERKAISGDPEYTVPDSVYGTENVRWVPLDGYQVGSPQIGVRFRAQVRAVPPSRSEAVRLGLNVARDQMIIRLRWRNDITSAMRVTLHGDSDIVYQIVGGPAEVEGRKEMIELVCERYV